MACAFAVISIIIRPTHHHLLLAYGTGIKRPAGAAAFVANVWQKNSAQKAPLQPQPLASTQTASQSTSAPLNGADTLRATASATTLGAHVTSNAVQPLNSTLDSAQVSKELHKYAHLRERDSEPSPAVALSNASTTTGALDVIVCAETNSGDRVMISTVSDLLVAVFRLPK